MSHEHDDFKYIIMKTQKKLLSAFSNRKLLTPILDDNGKSLMNSVYNLFSQLSNKKEANKQTSRWIKILLKINFGYINKLYNEKELILFESAQNSFILVTNTATSFWTIDHSYDYVVIRDRLVTLMNILMDLTKNHMTDKNRNKLRELFQTISSQEFLDKIFCCDKNLKSKDSLTIAVDNFMNNIDKMTEIR